MRVKKVFACLNGLLLAALLIGMFCYMEIGTLHLKATVSSFFSLLGAVNMVYAFASRRVGKKYPIVLTVGLVLAMLGDIYLGIDFMAGVTFFAMGHVLYFMSFCMLRRLCGLDIALGISFSALAIVILKLTPSLRFRSVQLEWLLMGYGCVISFMLGKAVGNALRERSLHNVLTAVGSAMFYFSDAMLVLYMFGGAPLLADRLCLFTYFPGQALLGHAVFYYVNHERKRVIA